MKEGEMKVGGRVTVPSTALMIANHKNKHAKTCRGKGHQKN
jgi:hypothetical protein